MKTNDPTICGLTEFRHTGTPVRLTDPGLTARLLADQTALANDLELAKELASDFRQIASDKTNEVAHIKGLLERTQADLARYEKHITELRAERHRLANEAMKTAGFEMQVRKLTAECARLHAENESLRQAAAGDEETVERVEELARMVQRLQQSIKKSESEPGPGRAIQPAAASKGSNVIDISFDR